MIAILQEEILILEEVLYLLSQESLMILEEVFLQDMKLVEGLLDFFLVMRKMLGNLF